MLKEWNKVIGLLNRGYSHDYVAKIFDCTTEAIELFCREQRAKGIYIKDLPPDGGIRPAPPKPPRYKNRVYTRLFNDYRNSEIAIEMMNGGYTYEEIAITLECDRTSVMAFRKRMLKSGVQLKEYNLSGKGIKIPWKDSWGEPVFQKKLKVMVVSEVGTSDIFGPKAQAFEGEKINPGKSSYAKYLEEHKASLKEIRKERMQKARETIENLRRWRKENNIRAFDTYDFVE